jgi:pyridoxal phosphate enzyme (YggS family)
MIAENLKNLRKCIELTCRNCGRDPSEIQLLAVSKAFPVESIKEAIESGQSDFGENYVQELQEKRSLLDAQPVHWHFIGHLQTNKVKHIAGYIHLIHSVDDLKLGMEIDKQARRFNRVQEVLVEIHTTDEATKFGVQPVAAIDLVKGLSQLSNLHVSGLMTMGPYSDDPNDSRKSFRILMEIKKKIEDEGIQNVDMDRISMGMSHDFEAAIEEGSTIIRIGTAIFGRRVKNLN